MPHPASTVPISPVATDAERITGSSSVSALPAAENLAPPAFDAKLACKVLLVDDRPSAQADVLSALAHAEGSSSMNADLPCAAAATDDAETTAKFTPKETFLLECAHQPDQAHQWVRTACQAGRPYAIVVLASHLAPPAEYAELTKQFWSENSRTHLIQCAEGNDHPLADIAPQMIRSGRLTVLTRPFAAEETQRLIANLEKSWRLEEAFISRRRALHEANLRLKTEIVRRAGIESHLRSLVNHDCLTMLRNRRGLIGQLDVRLTRRGVRRDGHRDALLFLNLDNFKSANDWLGYAAGDQLLRQIASRLLQCAHHSELAGTLGSADTARLGGDEFVVLLRDLDGPHHAFHVAQRVLAALARPFDLQGRLFSSGASIGIALLDDQIRYAADWLRQAETAMHRAKLEGKGRVAWFAEPAVDAPETEAAAAQRHEGSPGPRLL